MGNSVHCSKITNIIEIDIGKSCIGGSFTRPFGTCHEPHVGSYCESYCPQKTYHESRRETEYVHKVERCTQAQAEWSEYDKDDNRTYYFRKVLVPRTVYVPTSRTETLHKETFSCHQNIVRIQDGIIILKGQYYFGVGKSGKWYQLYGNINSIIKWWNSGFPVELNRWKLESLAKDKIKVIQHENSYMYKARIDPSQ